MSQWFLYFFFYSLTGYGLEKLYARASHSRNQVRKCFLFLPLCPVYGLAMTALLAAAPPEAAVGWLILLGMVICTAVEYAVHFFYDKLFRVQFWDYRLLRGNIHGRICPQFSLIWGVLSAAAVRWVQPLVSAAAAAIPAWAAFLMWMVLAVDCVFTASILLRRRDPELLAVPAALACVRSEKQSA